MAQSFSSQLTMLLIIVLVGPGVEDGEMGEPVVHPHDLAKLGWLRRCTRSLQLERGQRALSVAQQPSSGKYPLFGGPNTPPTDLVSKNLELGNNDRADVVF